MVSFVAIPTVVLDTCALESPWFATQGIVLMLQSYELISAFPLSNDVIFPPYGYIEFSVQNERH